MDWITHLIEEVVTTWVGGLEQSGYWGIFLLMAIESSFIPFPSEVVMIPAGVLAAEGRLNLWGAIAAGTAGSLAGALFNYYFALLVGRAFLMRYGRYFFLPADKIALAEKEWQRHGEITTFICRLLPVIRQLISIPAGLARMDLRKFCFWTTAGAGSWVLLLTLVGYYFGAKALEWWEQWKNEITIGLIIAAALLVATYVIRFRRRMAAAAKTAANADAS